ncbi:hypothetical protein CC80DRAFT_590806 [Byssothecium circinans]|uniref:C2H2-type domain-containing protein n=1 Tax=Byssothecium circinans TaxID=147558 RepID=A0A6A5U408_9PLEO|nr:hypothetical protein CC80DRAFT_590806 [Byssothecium circinans]
MPPRNNPLPNAVNVFNCSICDKGYPRQIDYENHLRSYDHNHRQRLADMKKLTASNESESSSRPSKSGLDMRSIPLGGAGKTAGLGSRFKKVGGGAVGAATGGSRFKKVGVAVSGSKEGYETKPAEKATENKGKVIKDARGDAEEKNDATRNVKVITETVADATLDEQADPQKDEDVVMVEPEDEEEVTWEEYDYTKPTGCDHANCAGCKPIMGGTYEDGWLIIGPT